MKGAVVYEDGAYRVWHSGKRKQGFVVMFNGYEAGRRDTLALAQVFIRMHRADDRSSLDDNAKWVDNLCRELANK